MSAFKNSSNNSNHNSTSKPQLRKETPKHSTFNVGGSSSTPTAHNNTSQTINSLQSRSKQPLQAFPNENIRTGTFLPDKSASQNTRSHTSNRADQYPSQAASFSASSSKNNLSSTDILPPTTTTITTTTAIGTMIKGGYTAAFTNNQTSPTSSNLNQPSNFYYPDEFSSSSKANHHQNYFESVSSSKHRLRIQQQQETNYFEQSASQQQQQYQLRQTNAGTYYEHSGVSTVENLIAKRGIQHEKYVPMDLFTETMNMFERRLNGIESRVDDNESIAQLNDRLFDLRSAPPTSARRREQIVDTSVAVAAAASFEIDQQSQSDSKKNNRSNQQQIQSSSQQLQQQQQQSTPKGLSVNFADEMDFQTRLDQIEKRVNQFEVFAKNVISDVEKKFIDYGKKLNVQIDRFFKNAQVKLEQNSEKDLKLATLAETIEQQMEIFKQTFRLSSEELVLNKEEIALSIQTLSTHVGKLDNRLNEHSIDFNENRKLIKDIEDDLIVMLHSYKDISEKVLAYRNVFDEVAFLKLNQKNILKNINLPAVHSFQNV